MIMIKIILDRKEPSEAEVRAHQDFNQILAAHLYQQKVNNPWRYWYYLSITCVMLMLV
jgi:hypothetical protein